MSKLTPISHNDLIKKLRRFGFEGPHSGGKHLYMLKGDLRLTVPNPHKKNIGVDLLIINKDTEAGRDNERGVD